MKSYTWWKQQKRRVQKKYTLFLSKYYSPKETKALEKKLIQYVLKHLERASVEVKNESKNID